MRAASLTLLIALLAGAEAGVAQNVIATAQLVVAAPTGSGTRNLSFGTITPMAGQTQVINVPAVRNPISASVFAGEFRFNVSTARGLDFTMTMPTELVASPSWDGLAFAANGMPYGAHCVTVNGSACALTNFNPSAPARVCHTTQGSGSCHANRFFSTGSELFVYIGGMLTVPPNPRAGTYTGTITLTIVQVY